MVDIIEKVSEVETITPSFVFSNAKEIAVLKDGRKIIHVILPTRTMKRLSVCSDLKVEKTKTYFDGIGNTQFIGLNITDVTKAFPELIGTKIIGVDEEDQDIVVPKILQHTWSGNSSPGETGYFVVSSGSHEKFRAEMKGTKALNVIEIKARQEYINCAKFWIDSEIEKSKKQPKN